MLLPHSQKKPIQFRLPTWGFKAMFLVVVLFAGITGFSYLSTMNLNAALNQKQQLEAELRQLSNEKQQMVEDNQKLRNDNASQDKKLGDLQDISDQNRQALDELHKREKEIKTLLGMDSPKESPDLPLQPAQSPTSEVTLAPTPDSTPEITPAPTPDPTSQPIPTAMDFVQAAADNAASDESGLKLIPLTQVKLLSPPDNGTDAVRQSLLTNTQEIAALSREYDSIAAKIEEKRSAKAQKKALRQQVAAYALQFVGGRYVFGGNDPHTGVDCSGFTRYVLSHAAGISLNRTAASQSAQGKAISLSGARPGDLVFYTKGGSVSHVAMYVGGGRVVHASTEKTGIIVTPVNYRQVYKVVNVLGG